MNLKQVAAVAGVSVSTVSRVLNGKSYVNEETRKIVTEAIRKTNYQPNALAQSLKMGRSNTICLMIVLQNFLLRSAITVNCFCTIKAKLVKMCSII